jgi:hypothetical protein
VGVGPGAEGRGDRRGAAGVARGGAVEQRRQGLPSRRPISQASDSNGAGASIGFSAGLLWSLRFDLDFGGVCLRSVGSGGMDHDGNCLTMLNSDYCSVTGKRLNCPFEGTARSNQSTMLLWSITVL